MMSFVRLVFAVLLTFALQSHGVPRFANYYQDHMVLQRAPHRAVVWGYGDSSTLTTLRINNQIYSTMSRTESENNFGESIWSVTLDPVSDDGPFDIHVSQPLANGTLVTITLHDVLFGDVWICSGQSNMEMAVIDIFNGTEEIANAGNYPKIRLFTVARIPSSAPLEELAGTFLNWSVASPQSVGGPSFRYMSAVCWLYGKMIHQALNGRPIGLIGSSWGGTTVELWMPPKALQDCGIPSNESDVSNSGYFNPPNVNFTDLFNSMIHPLTRMVIYGAIWYQGESNSAFNQDKYACTFAKMIEYWRQTWNQRTNGNTDLEFPFGFVQLCAINNSGIEIGKFPNLRWHQTFDAGYVPNKVLPKVFMAVTLDLGDDPKLVHPRDKQDVAYRLSRSGLAVAYNQEVEFQGPIVSNVSYSTGDKMLEISYTAVKNIELRNQTGFEVCCEGSQCLNDSIWLPAVISRRDPVTITLTVPATCVGKQLYGVHYLWHDRPCEFKEAAIYSSTDSNLPSPPFKKIF